MHYHDEMGDAVLRRYAASLNYRARQYQSAGQLNADDLRSLLLTSSGKCEWCHVSLVNSDFEIDHIISMSSGGANVTDNLAVSCMRCNRRKQKKSPLQFALEFVAAKGYKTPLVVRILALYDATAYKQHSLFDEVPDAETPGYTVSDAEDPHNPPDSGSYRW